MHDGIPDDILTGHAISLRDGAFHANFVGFCWSPSFLPYLCPLGVPEVRVCGYIQKALEKGYLEHPGSACCPDDMFAHWKQNL